MRKTKIVCTIGPATESEKIFKEAELTAIEEQAKADIEKAVEFANNSPDPELETALTDVYAD